MSAARDSKPRIFKIDPDEISAEAIGEAASILRSGGLFYTQPRHFMRWARYRGLQKQWRRFLK